MLSKKIKQTRQERLKALNHDHLTLLSTKLNGLDQELDQLLEMEECHWKQRARSNWLAHGDRNISYFHAHAPD